MVLVALGLSRDFDACLRTGRAGSSEWLSSGFRMGFRWPRGFRRGVRARSSSADNSRSGGFLIAAFREF